MSAVFQFRRSNSERLPRRLREQQKNLSIPKVQFRVTEALDFLVREILSIPKVQFRAWPARTPSSAQPSFNSEGPIQRKTKAYDPERIRCFQFRRSNSERPTRPSPTPWSKLSIPKVQFRGPYPDGRSSYRSLSIPKVQFRESRPCATKSPTCLSIPKVQFRGRRSIFSLTSSATFNSEGPIQSRLPRLAGPA